MIIRKMNDTPIFDEYVRIINSFNESKINKLGQAGIAVALGLGRVTINAAADIPSTAVLKLGSAAKQVDNVKLQGLVRLALGLDDAATVVIPDAMKSIDSLQANLRSVEANLSIKNLADALNGIKTARAGLADIDGLGHVAVAWADIKIDDAVTILVVAQAKINGTAEVNALVKVLDGPPETLVARLIAFDANGEKTALKGTSIWFAGEEVMGKTGGNVIHAITGNEISVTRKGELEGLLGFRAEATDVKAWDLKNGDSLLDVYFNGLPLKDVKSNIDKLHHGNLTINQARGLDLDTGVWKRVRLAERELGVSLGGVDKDSNPARLFAEMNDDARAELRARYKKFGLGKSAEAPAPGTPTPPKQPKAVEIEDVADAPIATPEVAAAPRPATKENVVPDIPAEGVSRVTTIETQFPNVWTVELATEAAGRNDLHYVVRLSDSHLEDLSRKALWRNRNGIPVEDSTLKAHGTGADEAGVVIVRIVGTGMVKRGGKDLYYMQFRIYTANGEELFVKQNDAINRLASKLYLDPDATKHGKTVANSALTNSRSYEIVSGGMDDAVRSANKIEAGGELPHVASSLDETTLADLLSGTGVLNLSKLVPAIEHAQEGAALALLGKAQRGVPAYLARSPHGTYAIFKTHRQAIFWLNPLLEISNPNEVKLLDGLSFSSTRNSVDILENGESVITGTAAAGKINDFFEIHFLDDMRITTSLGGNKLKPTTTLRSVLPVSSTGDVAGSGIHVSRLEIPKEFQLTIKRGEKGARSTILYARPVADNATGEVKYILINNAGDKLPQGRLEKVFGFKADDASSGIYTKEQLASLTGLTPTPGSAGSSIKEVQSTIPIARQVLLKGAKEISPPEGSTGAFYMFRSPPVEGGDGKLWLGILEEVDGRLRAVQLPADNEFSGTFWGKYRDQILVVSPARKSAVAEPGPAVADPGLAAVGPGAPAKPVSAGISSGDVYEVKAGAFGDRVSAGRYGVQGVDTDGIKLKKLLDDGTHDPAAQPIKVSREVFDKKLEENLIALEGPLAEGYARYRGPIEDIRWESATRSVDDKKKLFGVPDYEFNWRMQRVARPSDYTSPNAGFLLDDVGDSILFRDNILNSNIDELSESTNPLIKALVSTRETTESSAGNLFKQLGVGMPVRRVFAGTNLQHDNFKNVYVITGDVDPSGEVRIVGGPIRDSLDISRPRPRPADATDDWKPVYDHIYVAKLTYTIADKDGKSGTLVILHRYSSQSMANRATDTFTDGAAEVAEGIRFATKEEMEIAGHLGLPSGKTTIADWRMQDSVAPSGSLSAVRYLDEATREMIFAFSPNADAIKWGPQTRVGTHGTMRWVQPIADYAEEGVRVAIPLDKAYFVDGPTLQAWWKSEEGVAVHRAKVEKLEKAVASAKESGGADKAAKARANLAEYIARYTAEVSGEATSAGTGPGARRFDPDRRVIVDPAHIKGDDVRGPGFVEYAPIISDEAGRAESIVFASHNADGKPNPRFLAGLNDGRVDPAVDHARVRGIPTHDVPVPDAELAHTSLRFSGGEFNEPPLAGGLRPIDRQTVMKDFEDLVFALNRSEFVKSKLMAGLDDIAMPGAGSTSQYELLINSGGKIWGIGYKHSDDVPRVQFNVQKQADGRWMISNVDQGVLPAVEFGEINAMSRINNMPQKMKRAMAGIQNEPGATHTVLIPGASGNQNFSAYVRSDGKEVVWTIHMPGGKKIEARLPGGDGFTNINDSFKRVGIDGRGTTGSGLEDPVVMREVTSEGDVVREVNGVIETVFLKDGPGGNLVGVWHNSGQSTSSDVFYMSGISSKLIRSGSERPLSYATFTHVHAPHTASGEQSLLPNMMHVTESKHHAKEASSAVTYDKGRWFWLDETTKESTELYVLDRHIFNHADELRRQGKISGGSEYAEDQVIKLRVSADNPEIDVVILQVGRMEDGSPKLTVRSVEDGTIFENIPAPAINRGKSLNEYLAQMSTASGRQQFNELWHRIWRDVWDFHGNELLKVFRKHGVIGSRAQPPSPLGRGLKEYQQASYNLQQILARGLKTRTAALAKADEAEMLAAKIIARSRTTGRGKQVKRVNDIVGHWVNAGIGPWAEGQRSVLSAETWEHIFDLLFNDIDGARKLRQSTGWTPEDNMGRVPHGYNALMNTGDDAFAGFLSRVYFAGGEPGSLDALTIAKETLTDKHPLIRLLESKRIGTYSGETTFGQGQRHTQLLADTRALLLTIEGQFKDTSWGRWAPNLWHWAADLTNKWARKKRPDFRGGIGSDSDRLLKALKEGGTQEKEVAIALENLKDPTSASSKAARRIHDQAVDKFFESQKKIVDRRVDAMDAQPGAPRSGRGGGDGDDVGDLREADVDRGRKDFNAANKRVGRESAASDRAALRIGKHLISYLWRGLNPVNGNVRQLMRPWANAGDIHYGGPFGGMGGASYRNFSDYQAGRQIGGKPGRMGTLASVVGEPFNVTSMRFWWMWCPMMDTLAHKALGPSEVLDWSPCHGLFPELTDIPIPGITNTNIYERYRNVAQIGERKQLMFFLAILASDDNYKVRLAEIVKQFYAEGESGCARATPGSPETTCWAAQLKRDGITPEIFANAFVASCGFVDIDDPVWGPQHPSMDPDYDDIMFGEATVGLPSETTCLANMGKIFQASRSLPNSPITDTELEYPGIGPGGEPVKVHLGDPPVGAPGFGLGEFEERMTGPGSGWNDTMEKALEVSAKKHALLIHGLIEKMWESYEKKVMEDSTSSYKWINDYWAGSTRDGTDKFYLNYGSPRIPLTGALPWTDGFNFPGSHGLEGAQPSTMLPGTDDPESPYNPQTSDEIHAPMSDPK